MFKYFVRTTGERKLDESYKQIKYTLLVDKEHKPVDSYIEQLGLISEYDAILLEDDLILCSDFKKRIEKVIKSHPTDIINFYTSPDLYFESHRSQKFVFSQCAYYPKGIIKEFIEIMKQKKKYYWQYDLLESLAIKDKGLLVYNYRPCLVQHLDGKSLIQTGKGYKKRSIYFIDYLDALGVDYSEAYKSDIKEKLAQQLKENFENE